MFERGLALADSFIAFLSFQIVFRPRCKSALHLHDGKTRARELHASFRREMTLLRIADNDIGAVPLQTALGRPLFLRQTDGAGDMGLGVILGLADVDDDDVFT